MKKYCDYHRYRYQKFPDGHQYLDCRICGTVFLDTANQLTYEEKRDLITGVFVVIVGLPILWGFIWLYWIAFG